MSREQWRPCAAMGATGPGSTIFTENTKKNYSRLGFRRGAEPCKSVAPRSGRPIADRASRLRYGHWSLHGLLRFWSLRSRARPGHTSGTASAPAPDPAMWPRYIATGTGDPARLLRSAPFCGHKVRASQRCAGLGTLALDPCVIGVTLTPPRSRRGPRLDDAALLNPLSELRVHAGAIGMASARGRQGRRQCAGRPHPARAILAMGAGLRSASGCSR